MRLTKGTSQDLKLAGLLVLLSVFFYALDYAIFHKGRDIVFYVLMDVAFLFVQVLLVTVIIERWLTAWQRRSMLKKLNMVIGAFFGEVGTDLLKALARFDAELAGVCPSLCVTGQWSGQQFEDLRRAVAGRDYHMDVQKGDLAGLRDLMVGQREFLVRLLEHPNLLEHDRFTELMWAVFHLADELSHRPSTQGLPATDLQHLAGDMKRAYSLLVREWLFYMEHLKADYPYLFSLAVRTNPFDPRAQVIVDGPPAPQPAPSMG